MCVGLTFEGLLLYILVIGVLGRLKTIRRWETKISSKRQVEGYCVVYLLSRPGHVCNNKIQFYVRKFANDKFSRRATLDEVKQVLAIALKTWR